MRNEKQYYEDYWIKPSLNPDSDPTTPRRKRLLNKVIANNLPPKSPILDLGCGDGTFSIFLEESGYHAVGADISDKAIQKARLKSSGIDYRLMKADGGIPAQDGEFAAVWSSEVVEHVFDVDGHLSEVNRVLKPDGLYILTTPFHGVLKNIIIAVMNFDRHFAPDGEHIRFFDKIGLKRCLLNAGFQPLLWTGIGRIWPLYRTFFVVSKKSGSPKPAR